jgi:hypothetical protein
VSSGLRGTCGGEAATPLRCGSHRLWCLRPVLTLPPLPLALFASPAVSGQEPVCRVYNDMGEVVTLPHCMDNVMQCRTDPYLKAIGKNCVGKPWLPAARTIRCAVLLCARGACVARDEVSDAATSLVRLGRMPVSLFSASPV